MSRLFVPSSAPLVAPGTKRRVLRRPDLRTLLTPRPSGAPLWDGEVDFDDLIIHSAWREYATDAPDEVRYFMYQLSQRNPGAADYHHFFKATRLVRLTRVPRYLRGAAGHAGPNLVFEQQRDVLAALREQQVLFLNIIAKSPQLPLVFSYGVQGVGQTPAEAQAAADRAYAVLTYQLDGTYQQLEYAPLTVAEGELLARYQAEWDHLAMGRGRPMPVGSTLGSASLLDGNRTDVESTNNQLESFIRAMNDRSFMLSMVTVPLSPAEMTVAWRNVSQHLSKVRSDQQGSRSVSAGVAIPFTLGTALGTSSGDSHSTGTSAGAGQSAGVSHSLTDTLGTSVSDGSSQGVSVSHADSLSHSAGLSHSDGTSAGQSMSASQGVSHSDSTSTTLGQSQSASLSHALGQSMGLSIGHTDSTASSVTHGQSQSQTVSVGQSVGQNQGVSVSDGRTISTGASLGQSASAGSSWSNTLGQSLGSSLTGTDGVSGGHSDTTSTGLNLGASYGDGLNGSASTSSSAAIHGGLLGIGGNQSSGASNGVGDNQSAGSNTGINGSWGGSNSSGWSHSQASGLTQGVNVGQSTGGSLGHTITGTNSVGDARSVTTGQSLGSSATQSASQSASTGTSVAYSQGVGAADSTSLSQGVSQTDGAGLSTGVSLARGVGASDGTNAGLATGVNAGTSASDGSTVGVGASTTASQGASAGLSHTQGASASTAVGSGTSQSLSNSQGLSDAYMVAMSRNATMTGSLAFAPSLGVAVAKQTFDEAKRVVGDMLEAQQRRYLDGLEGGAFLYQMFLTCPDEQTLAGASGLLKAAFWGPGGADTRLPQPFHVVDRFDEDPDRHEAEKRRLLAHARAFTSYRRREPVTELVEPYLYSSYLTTTEAAAFCHPPTSEATGLLAVWDSAPVMAMPANRQNRDVHLGHVFNGERGKVSGVRYGLDLDEIKHFLVAGTTGSGKTTTMMRLLTEAATAERTVITPPTAANPLPTPRTVRAGILGLDWMHNMRKLAQVVEPERFRFYSVSKPDLGEFRFNPLALPDDGVNPAEWIAALADNFVASFSLGEFGRSLLHEFLTELYTANRLEPFVLRPAGYDNEGTMTRPPTVLDPVDRSSLPAGAIVSDGVGGEYANVFSCPQLSRLIDLSHVALMVLARSEELATPDGARLYGTSMRDRIQSLWRRMAYYAPGQPLAWMLRADPSLAVHETLGVRDLVDPDLGLVTVIETDGLDQANRRLILGTVLLAVFRYGMHHGEGVFDQNGSGPGTFVVLEEAHELLGERGEDEDAASAQTRVALYESLFRRARALGLRLGVVVQNASAIPMAITSNTSTVFVHRQYDKADRDRVFSLLNMSNMIGQHLREYRYLGELPTGHCIVRLDARNHYLESAPTQILTDPPELASVPDSVLAARR